MSQKTKMRRPSTSKRVLRALELGLDAVNIEELDQYQKEEHKRASAWIANIREYNRFRTKLRAKWHLLKIRAERKEKRGK